MGCAPELPNGMCSRQGWDQVGQRTLKCLNTDGQRFVAEGREGKVFGRRSKKMRRVWGTLQNTTFSEESMYGSCPKEPVHFFLF